jgi:thiamine-phosphate pyrophosphorylase
MKKNKSYRLLDANLNRAREGLRVIEDTARFLLGDARLCRKIRSMRHALAEVSCGVYPSLIGSRDSVSDTGRSVPEGGRKNIGAIIAANFRRVEEALRVLEEYSKLVSPDAGSRFKDLRYETYCLEKKMAGIFGRNRGL